MSSRTMFPAMCLVSVAKFRNSARLEPKRYNSKNMHNMNHMWSVTNVTMDLILVEMLYEWDQVFSMTVCVECFFFSVMTITVMVQVTLPMSLNVHT